MGTPTFGIFDHIEDIPGTPTPQLLRDRLDLIKMADEAGFAGYHLAEHHGSDLCMAPNQEVFIAAASQITKNIRLGPMVKLLPLHHPVRIIEDMIVVDNLTDGRLDFGVGRGVAPIEHYWFGSNWPESKDRFVDVLGIICDAFATGEISSENSKFYDFPTIPMSTKPVQDPIPFWYPGSPVTAGRHGMNLMWPGPIDQAVLRPVRRDVERAQGRHAPRRRTRLRAACRLHHAAGDRARPRTRHWSIVRRGMTGLLRRAHNVHKYDHLVLSDEECDALSDPLRGIMAHMEDAIHARCGNRGADQGSLRRHPRARAHRLHRAAAPRGRHDTRRGQAHDGPLLQRRQARRSKRRLTPNLSAGDQPRRLGIIVVGGEGDAKKRTMMSAVWSGCSNGSACPVRGRHDCQLGIRNGLVQRTGVCQFDQVVVADHDQRGGRGDERQIGCAHRRLGREQLETLRRDLAEMVSAIG